MFATFLGFELGFSHGFYLGLKQLSMLVYLDLPGGLPDRGGEHALSL